MSMYYTGKLVKVKDRLIGLGQPIFLTAEIGFRIWDVLKTQKA